MDRCQLCCFQGTLVWASLRSSCHLTASRPVVCSVSQNLSPSLSHLPPPPGPWEEFLQKYSEQNGDCLDSVTTDLVFRSVRRKERGGRNGEEVGGVAKRQKLEEREGPPVVLLTGISQSIARKLREVDTH